MSATVRKSGEFAYDEALKHRLHKPKFGPNGTKYGTKGERKHRDNHKNRRTVEAIIETNKTNAHQMPVRQLRNVEIVTQNTFLQKYFEIF